MKTAICMLIVALLIISVTSRPSAKDTGEHERKSVDKPCFTGFCHACTSQKSQFYHVVLASQFWSYPSFILPNIKDLL